MRHAYVIGTPIGHSLSPHMHNAAFTACGIDARYEAVDVPAADLAAWTAAARRPEVLGFNVTVPHKEAIVPHLDRLVDDARTTGAVNTVIVSPPAAGSGVRLVGTNTDTVGFRRSLAEEAGTKLGGQRVVLLGAGGAARAIALVAVQDGAAHLAIANRHLARAQQLAADLAALAATTRLQTLELEGPDLGEALATANVVVNATSVGLRSAALPIPPDLIQPGCLVVDIVYNPLRTAFLDAAAHRGAAILGGLGMLVYQAAAAFEHWTGLPAPIPVMRAAAERALQDVP